MKWNLAPECTSLVIICIVFFYAQTKNVLPTLRNFLFKLCFIGSIITVLFNIITGIVLMEHAFLPQWILWLVNMLYYLTTPISGIFFLFYSLSVLTEDTKKVFRLSMIGVIPTVLYLFVVLTNPFSHLIFNVLPKIGYVRGPWIALSFIMVYYYCAIVFVLANMKCFNVSKTQRLTLISFPIAAFLAIVIQQFFSNLILSGTATACVLIIIYLTIENKQISLDALTNIPTRQVLLDMLKLNLTRKNNASLIVLSLKKFKVINNRYGQPGGNLILQQVACFLKSITKDARLYRFGGDEFAILMDNNQDVDNLITVILNRMNVAWDIGSDKVTVFTAIGVVQYDASFDSVEEIILGVEHAVICAKQREGNSCIYCTSQMISDIHRRENIIEILKNTIVNNDIVLYYQSIFDVDFSKFLFAESLVRIPNSPLGSLSPDEFIPIAESTGLIVPLTYQIMEKICLFIKELIDANIEFSAIHINFSAMQFLDENFEEKVLDIIKRQKIPFSKIKIELTESVLAENYDVVKDYIIKMCKQGLRFGLDDFGTGYSNISMVLQIPWDTIKLDRSLIVSAITNESSALIVKHIVSAFLSLGICVLAEGVETVEQRDFAIGIGCKQIQGFYYAKPLPPEAVKGFFLK
ncbi:MAG: EAL domain-containing protein [Lachnospiraceae bacterium]